MQVVPIRWIFIKSPIPRQPYSHIRKLYEVELSNTKSKYLSDLEKKKLLSIRENTKRILIQKKKKEIRNSVFTLLGIMAVAILIVYFIIK